MEGGKLVGILTQTDAMRVVAINYSAAHGGRLLLPL